MRLLVKPTLIRREDLLHLNFYFVNLGLVIDETNTKPPYLTRNIPDHPAYIVVFFPPQSIIERTFFESEVAATTDPLGVPPIRARMSGRSRLAFKVKDEVAEIPYTVENLLDWTQYEPSLVAHALAPPTKVILPPIEQPPIMPPIIMNRPSADGEPVELEIAPGARILLPIPPAITEPLLHHTAIEFPYRLYLSPNEKSAWAHSLDAVTHKGRTELWHTRLGVQNTDPETQEQHPVDEVSTEDRTVRAVWTPDFNPEHPEQPQTPDLDFPQIDGIERIAVTPDNRRQILRSTSDYSIRRFANLKLDYYAEPVDVEQLMLTSQGAWAGLSGHWNPFEWETALKQENLGLVEWKHDSTHGRDHYVRIVNAGFLFPWRNITVQIIISERKFLQVPGTNEVAAYTRKYMFLMVRQPIVRYAANLYDHDGREMPLYRQVRVKTIVTPKLDPPDLIVDNGATGAFWVNVAGQPFQFNMEGIDNYGNTIHFPSTAIWYPFEMRHDAAAVSTVASVYDAAEAERECFVPNEKVAYAENNPGQGGSTQLETESMFFTAQLFPDTSVTVPPWLPKLEKAKVHIPPVDQLVSNQGTQTIKLYQKHLDTPNGLLNEAANKAGIFAQLLTPKGAAFTAEKGGGLSNPSFNIGGISQHLGAVSGGPNVGDLETRLDELANGTFDPAKFFEGFSARLLGGIELFDIITTITSGTPGFETQFGAQFPKMTTRAEPNPQNPTSVVTRLDWTPEVKDINLAFFKVVFQGDKKNSMRINVRMEQFLNDLASPPALSVEGAVDNFKVTFVEIIGVQFDQIKFIKEDNEKLDVHVDIPEGGIKFEGPLKFLNELENFFSPGQFMDPPSLDISTEGVGVGFSILLPPLAVGVFALTNVNLGASLYLPFGSGPDDKMRLRFNFSERHDTFRINVMMFAGGGFFAIALGVDGLEVIEAALEFGAAISINLGVASGGVSVMAGIYFKLEIKSPDPDTLELTAYLRMNGNLSVLGLVSISIEFYLELRYKEIGGSSKLTGRATVTVEVEVLFFSASVSMTVERTFAGDADDPTFSDALEPGDWYEYGEAFALA